MDISIIIINYNTKNLTAQCLESIYTHTKNVDFEIILVDNGSSDDSVAYISRVFPRVRLITCDENIGFGRANNLGVKTAKGEFIFLLNSDAFFKNNVLKYFLDNYKKLEVKYKNIGVLGCRMQSADESFCSSFNSFHSTVGDLKNILKYNILKIQNKDISTPIEQQYIEVDWVVGANLFLKKTLFDKFSGFDPSFFMYYEEVDFQKRTVKEGYNNFIITAAELVHLEGGSSQKKASNWKRIMFDRSRFIYYKKHSSPMDYFFYRIIFFLLRFPSIVNPNYSAKENIAYVKNLLV